MSKLESLGAVHTHTHTHTICSYQKECWKQSTRIDRRFFEGRILLSMLTINNYIDNKGKTGIDCITVGVRKRALMAI